MFRCFVVIMLAVTVEAVAATTSPTTRPLAPEARDKAARWLNVAGEAVAGMPDYAKPYYSHMVLEMQVRCDPAADGDAVIDAMAAFKYDPPRPFTLGFWYTRVGQALGKNGDLKAHQRCMDLADDQAMLCDDPDDSYHVRRNVLLTIKAVQGLDAAVAFIESITSARWRAEFYCDIVTGAIDPPTTQQSRELVRKAKADAEESRGGDDPERVNANLAIALINVGQLDEAESYMDRLTTASWRTHCARELAAAHWNRGDDAKYRTAVKRFDSAAAEAIDPAARYAYFAEALYKVSPKTEWKTMLEKASKLADELGDADREDALRALASAQITCNQLDEATKTIGEMKMSARADYFKARVAVARAKAGDFAVAEKTLDELKDAGSRQYLLAELFRLESDAGRDQHLDELLKGLKSDDERVRAACGVLTSIWSTPGRDDSEVERSP